jgi:ubiquitin-like 1-activating enzyme E1 B
MVAKETALKFNPNVKIVAHHDSIFNPAYGSTFYQRFSMVLNALDNRAARNHVNRMCLHAKIPLIESGTSGYDGQVELILRGVTQCYECTPKSAQKTYPGCTIRNTPSEPIHCIVWAKHLFNQLFGEHNADEDVSPDTADPDAAGEAGQDAMESESTEAGNVARVSTKQWAENCDYLAEKLFNKFFYDDINYLLSMDKLWKTRAPPKPMKFGDLDVITEVGEIAGNAGVLRDQKVWSAGECQSFFAQSINNLKEQALKLKEGDHLVWDKDDQDAMDFVTACANIRSMIFSIPQKSRFDVKSMAGNIIPAIASTNAIAAGFVVLHAFKILEKKFDKCQSVYMRLRANPRNQIFVPDNDLSPPNSKCYVCSDKPELVLKIDTNVVTVKELRDEVIVKEMSIIKPDVEFAGKGIIIISSDPDDADMNELNEGKLLKDMSIVDGCVLKVEDNTRDYELIVTIIHKTAERDEPKFEIIADKDVLKPVETPAEVKKPEEPQPGPSGFNGAGSSNGAGPSNGKKYESDDDDIEIIEESEVSSAEKRKNLDDDDDEDTSPSTKRPRIEEPKESAPQDDDDTICID